MDDKEIRKKILERLYQEFREKGVASEMPIDQIGLEIGVDENIINSSVAYLEGKGFIRYAQFGSIAISPEGIDAIDNKIDAPESSQSIVINKSQVGPIIQAQRIDFSPSIFLEQLTSHIQNHPEIPQKTKKGWTDFLKDIPKIILEQVIRAAFDKVTSGR